MMKKRSLKILLVILCMCVLQGCSVNFSKGRGNEDMTVASNMVDAESDGKIVMENMTLALPDGMKYGTQDTDTGKVYYVWATDAEQMLPTDEDIILYVYEGNDINSPDKELTNQEARISIQSYIQIFRELLNVSISSDPDVTENAGWYAFQFTGCSGEYETTSYGTMCYPKYYYGVYTLERLTEDYNRNFYGFIFSNDSVGEVMSEDEYNFIYNQVKNSFSITEFYTLPQLEYDEATDYSNGYNYDQLLKVFAEVQNYHGIQKNKDIYEEYDFVCVEKDFTISVNDGMETMSVKLIGVDIPSVEHENSEDAETAEISVDSGNTAGALAMEYMEQLLDGKKIYLEYDGAKKDENGHILAYVYLDDKETMLNKLLLEKGFARYASAEPSIKYAAEFDQLENNARKKCEGLWKAEAEEEKE